MLYCFILDYYYYVHIVIKLLYSTVTTITNCRPVGELKTSSLPEIQSNSVTVLKMNDSTYLISLIENVCMQYIHGMWTKGFKYPKHSTIGLHL